MLNYSFKKNRDIVICEIVLWGLNLVLALDAILTFDCTVLEQQGGDFKWCS